MFLRLSLLFIFLLSPLQAFGHKIHVFAWVSGDIVTVESNFSGNHPLVNGKVTVKNNQTAELILEGMGDEKGVFTFEIPPPVKEQAVDILITVSGGDGHRSEWLIPATEYLSEKTVSPISTNRKINNTELETIIQKVLEKELAPIKRSLAKADKKKPDFRDIIGGVGYLLGLAGLIAWLKNRKPASRQKE